MIQPEVIELGLTTRCNLNKCEFCFRCQTPNPIPKMDLDPEIVKREFTREFLKGVKKLSLIGSMGDIMCYPHIFEVIDHLAENCQDDLVVCTDTNGSAMSKDWWQELAIRMNQFKCYHLRFCLDGMGKEHEMYRIGTKYDKIIRNMQTFIDAGGKAVWKFIVFKHNEHQIEEASKLAKEMGCTIFLVVISGIHNEQLEKSTIYQMDKFPGIVCRSLDTNYLSIDADGEVMPCCWFKPIKNQIRCEKIYWDNMMLMLKYFKNKKKLNLYTSTIQDALNTDFFSYIYENHKDIQQCRDFCGENRRRPDNIIPRVDIFIETPGIRYKC